LVVKLLGIKYAFGWQLSHTTLFSKWQEKYSSFINERDRLLKMLSHNQLEIANPTFLFGLNGQIKTKVNLLLQQKNITQKDKNIGIVTGGKLERNRWPLANFIKVVEYYLDKGYNILIFGGPDDSEQAQKIIFHKNVFNFCGTLIPLETVEAMKYCSVVIANDTGPMHMAYAVGTPLVALFSSRDYPGKWYPPNDAINKVFRTEGVHCSICFHRKCASNICMQQIQVEQAIKATDQILAKINKDVD